MESEQKELAALVANVAAQMRGALGNLHLAAAQLVPAVKREEDPDLDARAAVLDKSYYQLLRLVNNLTLAGRLGDERPLNLQDRDMVDLVGELCERAADLAPQLELEVRFICALDRHICAVDPDAIEQILYQLLSNAFKFTPAGGTVTVELRVIRERILLSVEDTGCGISEEQLAALFEQYIHSKQAYQPHGLGLGLALCKRLAEGHGGVLMAESRPGRGSRFTLSLPDKQLGGGVSDVPFDYSGGFNRTLLAFADALPAKAFLMRNQD